MQTEVSGQTKPSLPPLHHLLRLLDENMGKPQTVKSLTEELCKQISARDGLLLKYVNLDALIEDDLQYMQRLRLIDRLSTPDGESARITSLGSFIALGL